MADRARRSLLDRITPAPIRRRIYRDAITDVAKAIGGLPAMPSIKGPGTVVDLAGTARALTQVAAPVWGATPEDIQAALAEQGMEFAPPFSPGRPLNPYYGYSAPPRIRDYPVGENITTRPRWNRISFDTLRGIIDSYDVAKIAIRHLIRDVTSLDVLYQPMPGVTDEVDDDIEAAQSFLKKPDGQLTLSTWLSKWLNDVLRYDAGPIYKRRNERGDLIGLDVIDGTTIAPLIDYFGRRPEPDAPAFLQWIQGLPWDWLTTDDVIYMPLNPVSDSSYGMAPIEDVLLTANTDIRFQWYFLQFFTEGTIPEGIMHAPPDQSDPTQVEQWQEVWDAFLEGDQAMKHKVRWVPHGADWTPTKTDKFDETFPMYLMRRTVAAFGVTPNDLGFTESVNRATGDTQVDVQFRVGTAPILGYVEDVLNSVLQDDLGLKVQIQFDDGQEKEDRYIEAQAHQVYVTIGAESPEEVRRDVLGLPVSPDEMTPRFILSRTGPVPLKSIIEIAGDVDEKTGSPKGVEQVELGAGITPRPTSALHNPGETDQLLAAQRAAEAAGEQTPPPGGPPVGAPVAGVPGIGAPTGDAAEKVLALSDATLAKAAALVGAGATWDQALEWVEHAEELADRITAHALAKDGETAGIDTSTGITGADLVRGGDDDSVIDVPSLEIDSSIDPDTAKMLRQWRDNSRKRVAKGWQPRWFTGLDPDTAIPVWRRLRKARTREQVDDAFAKAVDPGKGPARPTRRARTGTPSLTR